MRLNSLCLLPSSWHSSAGFPYFFAAIARGPLAFATRWIWAADFAESIETAAVRAPLCLRFPLLLSSVQAGVGLLSPPPTRRCGFILRFSRVWRKLLQLLGLPPRRLPTLSGLRRARAFRQLRPRRAMPRLHGLLSRRIQFSILSSVVAADGRLSRVMRPRRQSVFSGRRLRSRQHRLGPRRDRLQSVGLFWPRLELGHLCLSFVPCALMRHFLLEFSPRLGHSNAPLLVRRHVSVAASGVICI